MPWFLRALLLLIMLGGCDSGASKPDPPNLSIRPSMPLSIHPSESPTRVFSSEEEIPTTFSTFNGARGSVRLTLEVEGSTDSAKPKPISVNDVSFRAVGEGRISLSIERPRPEHPNGRVTILCSSGQEESSANFEPELWFHKPGAIVTFESVGGEPLTPLVEGKEIILGRYIARNLPHDVRLTLKAMFSKEPVAARTNAGVKPLR